MLTAHTHNSPYGSLHFLLVPSLKSRCLFFAFPLKHTGYCFPDSLRVQSEQNVPLASPAVDKTTMKAATQDVAMKF